MKKSLIFIIALFTFFISKSQNFNVEPGITIGTSYYLGELNHTQQFYSPGLAAGLAFRHSFNDYYAIRLNILRASISGDDADFSNIYQQTRAHSFKNSIYEFGLQAEINFSDFNSNVRKSSALYITSGLALAISNSFQSYSLAIPFGVGYKYSITKKLTLSAEWVFRNATSDNLDLLVPLDITSKQISKKNNPDWYSIASVTATYNLQSDKKWCPAYKKQRK